MVGARCRPGPLHRDPIESSTSRSSPSSRCPSPTCPTATSRPPWPGSTAYPPCRAIGSGPAGSWRTTRGRKIATAQQAVDEAEILFQTYLSWGINGQEGDPTAFIAWLKQTQDVLRRGIAAVEKENADMRAWAPTATFVNNPPGYPKGSAALDVGLTFSSKDVWDLLPQNKKGLLSGQPTPTLPPGPPAKGKVTLRMVVVPDGDGHFWWGASADPGALQSTSPKCSRERRRAASWHLERISTSSRITKA